MKIECICTIADGNYREEVAVMLRSAGMHSSAAAVVVCDEETADFLGRQRLGITLDLHPIIAIRPAEHRQGWAEGAAPNEYLARLTSFFDYKRQAMEIALRRSAHVLFADCDVVFVGELDGIELRDHDLALSPHYTADEAVAVYGRFNAGYLATKERGFPDWWRRQIGGPDQLDQLALNAAPQRYRTYELPFQHNFGWWRLHHLADAEFRRRVGAFAAESGALLYEGRPMVSFHSHTVSAAWYPNADDQISRFNRFMTGLLRESGAPAHAEVLALIERMAMARAARAP